MEENLRIARLMDFPLQSPTLSNEKEGEGNMDCVVFPDFTFRYSKSNFILILPVHQLLPVKT